MNKPLRWLIGILVFIAIWQVASLLINKSIILPAPARVFTELAWQLTNRLVWIAALETAWKVLLALILVLLAGVSTGLLLGVNETLRDCSRPIIMVIQAVPVISWLTLVLFTWGPGWEGPVFIAFLSLIPIAILTTVSGVQNLDLELLEMARLYKVDRLSIIKDIYLGSLLPFIIAIIDVTIGQAWKVILVAEYLAGDSGLGVMILSARYEVNAVKLYAITLLAVILGITTERMLKSSLGRVSKLWLSAL